MECNICRKAKVNNIKSDTLKGNIKRFCLDCQTKHKVYIKNLLDTENKNLYFRFNKADTEQEFKQQEQNELKQIAFNVWILEERQQEKKFLEQQTNKNFLSEQFKKDLDREIKADRE